MMENEELEGWKECKRAGPFLIGPRIGQPIAQGRISLYLARMDGTDAFYTIKVMTLKSDPKDETPVDKIWKVLFHGEHAILNLLVGMEGVIQNHGLFENIRCEEILKDGNLVSTERRQRRLMLVLDCFTPQDYCSRYKNLITLKNHITKHKRLTESDAVQIFYNLIRIVGRLHDENFCRLNLSVGNIVLNKETGQVVLTNFIGAKHSSLDKLLLFDGVGSPPYTPPEVISRLPYLGKPSDMWALGISFFTMLVGKFSFYDKNGGELERKILAGEFHIPTNVKVSTSSVLLIHGLLKQNPGERLTCPEVLVTLEQLLGNSKTSETNFQVVPDILPQSMRDQDSQNKAGVRTEIDTAMEIEGNLSQMLPSMPFQVTLPQENNDEDTRAGVQEVPGQFTE